MNTKDLLIIALVGVVLCKDKRIDCELKKNCILKNKCRKNDCVYKKYIRCK